MKHRSGYVFKRGSNYFCQWRVEGKTFVRRLDDDAGNAITTKDEAEQARQRLMAPFTVGARVEALEMIKGKLEGAKGELALLEEAKDSPLQLSEAWSAFDACPARPDSGERTFSDYTGIFERFKEWLAKTHPSSDKETPLAIPLNIVTAAVAQQYAREMIKGKVSPATFNKHLNLLEMVWRVLSKEIQAVNPWTKATISRRKLDKLSCRKQALTAGQFDNLLVKAESQPDLKDLFTILGWTGLRLVDGVKLTWGAVDFARRVITLAPQKTVRRTGKTVSIPMFPAVIEVLNRRQSGHVLNPKRFVFPDIAEDYDRDTGASLSKKIIAVFEAAGMQTSAERAGRGRAVSQYGAHSLRHHFISAATMAGLPGAMVKAIVGHSGDQMLEHYQHIGTDAAEEMAKRIGGMTAALPTPEPNPADPLAVFKTKVKKLAEGMTTNTWRTLQAELLAIAS